MGRDDITTEKICLAESDREQFFFFFKLADNSVCTFLLLLIYSVLLLGLQGYISSCAEFRYLKVKEHYNIEVLKSQNAAFSC